MSGNQIHDRAPPPKSGFQTLTQSVLQEGGGAEVEPGEGTEGQVHVGPMRQQGREGILGRPLWREVSLAGWRRREVTLAGRRGVTLAGRRRRGVTLAGRRRRGVTPADQAPTRAEQTRQTPIRAEQT